MERTENGYGTEVFDFDTTRGRADDYNEPKELLTENATIEPIGDILHRMKLAAIHDRELYAMGRLPTKKLALLRQFEVLLKKKQLKEAFLEQGLLHIIALWMKPLNADNIPLYQMHETFLKLLLHDYRCVRTHHLKKSGLGGTVMLIASSPHASAAHRRYARKLIDRWSRDVYDISADFRGLSAHDRLRMDMKRLAGMQSVANGDPGLSQQTVASDGSTGYTNRLDIPVIPDAMLIESCDHGKSLLNRARVPMPESTVFVKRPQSQLSANWQTEPSAWSKYDQIKERFLKRNNRK